MKAKEISKLDSIVISKRVNDDELYFRAVEPTLPTYSSATSFSAIFVNHSAVTIHKDIFQPLMGPESFALAFVSPFGSVACFGFNALIKNSGRTQSIFISLLGRFVILHQTADAAFDLRVISTIKSFA